MVAQMTLLRNFLLSIRPYALLTMGDSNKIKLGYTFGHSTVFEVLPHWGSFCWLRLIEAVNEGLSHS